MKKQFHEIRDPIHVFVRLDTDERKVVDSVPFQRLRHIKQLAMTYLVYPGAVHTRFEHSLGVMELASRVYDVITKQENVHSDLKGIVPNARMLQYWRTVLRMAALCHDLGHLPFSHAGEKELLAEGWNHEKLTLAIVHHKSMAAAWSDLKVSPKDVAKIAVGPKEYDEPFDEWEAILSEIIVGDALGVDRMDYLLRDSHHAGVAYGRFDHYRLIDTMRILPKPWDSNKHALGVEEGGLHSAEALLLARYFMFTQLYIHPIRRIYDYHLQQFLKAWLPGGRFSTDVAEHLKKTDNEVWSAVSEADRNPGFPGHEAAKRIVRRDHFKRLYDPTPDELELCLEPAEAVYAAAREEFGEESLHLERYKKEGKAPGFPVLAFDGQVVHSHKRSEVLQHIPKTSINCVFICSDLYEVGKRWLEGNRTEVISRGGEGEES